MLTSISSLEDCASSAALTTGEQGQKSGGTPYQSPHLVLKRHSPRGGLHPSSLPPLEEVEVEEVDQKDYFRSGPVSRRSIESGVSSPWGQGELALVER